jgi:hypothetical protein
LHGWENGAYFILLSDGSAHWVLPEELNEKAKNIMDGFRKHRSAAIAAARARRAPQAPKIPKLVAGGETAAPIRSEAPW